MVRLLVYTLLVLSSIGSAARSRPAPVHGMASARTLTMNLASLMTDHGQTAWTEAPIPVHVQCPPPGSSPALCYPRQVIVPFFIGGPGSGVWVYAARLAYGSTHALLLIDFAFLPYTDGIPQWSRAAVGDSQLVVETLRWGPDDPHANPTQPGKIRITLVPSLLIEDVTKAPSVP